jgi:rhamnosyltransferase subunit B
MQAHRRSSLRPGLRTDGLAVLRGGSRSDAPAGAPRAVPHAVSGAVAGGAGADARHEPYVPFSHVLPRCAAIAHHGGIGTCGQGLAAGVPQLTMPLGFDQPDNTTRLWRLGVARWVRPHVFRGERVAAELAALLSDSGVAERCGHWAQEMRRSDPVGETCALLETLVP